MGEASRTKKTLEDRIDKVERLLKEFVGRAAQSFGSVFANEKSLEMSLEHLDMNDRALRFILLELFGQLHWMRTLVQLLANDPGLSDHSKGIIRSLNLDDIREEGHAWLERVAKSAFETAKEEKLRDEEENKKLAEKMRAEAEEAKKQAEAEEQRAKSEAELANQVLSDAEKRNRLEVSSGGEGSKAPEGAFLFGG